MNQWIETWKTVLTNPKDVFASQKKNATLMDGVKQYAISGLLSGILAAIAIMFLGAVGGAAGVPGAAALGGLGALGAIITAVAISVIGSLLFGGVTYLMAKLFGGKASFDQHYYLPSLFAVPIALISGIIGWVPIIGMIAILVNLYMLYLLTLAYKEAHGFDTMKAVLVWLIPVIALMVIAMVFAVALAGIFGASLLGGLSNLPIGN